MFFCNFLCTFHSILPFLVVSLFNAIYQSFDHIPWLSLQRSRLAASLYLSRLLSHSCSSPDHTVIKELNKTEFLTYRLQFTNIPSHFWNVYQSDKLETSLLKESDIRLKLLRINCVDQFIFYFLNIYASSSVLCVISRYSSLYSYSWCEM